MKRLVEKATIFPSLTPQVPSSAVPTRVSLKYYNHVTFIVQVTNDSTGGTAAAITLKQSTDANGADEKALEFDTVWAVTNVENAKAPLVKTAVTNNTFNTASTADTNALYVIEVNAEDLDTSNGFDYIRVGVGDAEHATVSVLAILDEARYPQAQPAQSAS